MHVTDWLPTLTRLAGANVPPRTAKPLDGIDVWSSLVEPATPSPRTELLYNINPLCDGGQAGAPKAAIRIGSYKLLAWCFFVKGIGGGTSTGPVAAPNGTKGVDPEFSKGHGVVLYNLDEDPTESTNLAGMPAHEATVKQLLARLVALAQESVEPQQWTPPYQGKEYECAACPLHPAGLGPTQPWISWIP